MLTSSATETVKSMKPRSFNEVMAGGLTLMVWGFAIVVYLRDGVLPDWLLALTTSLVGFWMKPPGTSS